MDPLTALSLASSIAQVLDFGTKLFKGTREIAARGSQVTVQHLTILSSDTEGVNKGLVRHFTPLGGKVLSEEEHGLVEVATHTLELNEEIHSYLETLVQEKGSKDRWKSFKTALRTICGTKRLEELEKRLGEYRSQLTLRLLVVLNVYHSKQSVSLGELRRMGQEIIEALAVHPREYDAHLEPAAAILTSRNGEQTTLLGRPTVVGDKTNNKDKHRSTINPPRTSTTFINNSVKGEADFWTRPERDCGKLILDSLHFRGITQRQESIPQPHKRSFEWIWIPEENHVWDDLHKWLEKGSGSYWISGKAGSGKSSLVKYLLGDPRTYKALREWAGPGKQLVVAPFFFWYAGTPLQKSHAGLLRGLLFAAILARPELAITLFPDVCREFLSDRSSATFDATVIEIKLAFSRLLDSVPDDLKIIFFIDGLDEYTGDLNELCDLFARAANSPSVKLLLSSRPIPVCHDRFARYPKLRLQDLTRRDIEQYAKDHLENNSILKSMEDTEDGLTCNLIETIIAHACGVFLWVVLVVRHIVTRLQNYDSVSELRKEIDNLPPDLEQLYDRMLGSMCKEYQITGSKFLQLALKNMEISPTVPITAFQLSFAEDEDYNRVIQSQLKQLTEAEKEWRCKALEGRLRSRCCGLLEVQESCETYIPDEVKAPPTVGFIHRTVVEFLQMADNWRKMSLLTANTKFDAEKALVASSVAVVMSLPNTLPGSVPYDSRMEIMSRVASLVILERVVSDRTRVELHDTYMPRFKMALANRLPNPSSEGPADIAKAVVSSVDKICSKIDLSYPSSFIFHCKIALPHLNDDVMGLGFNVSKQACLRPAHFLVYYLVEQDPKLRLLVAESLLSLQFTPTEEYLTTDVLGACRMKPYYNSTPRTTLWDLLLYYAHYVIVEAPDHQLFEFDDAEVVLSLLDVISSFLERGATVDKMVRCADAEFFVTLLGFKSHKLAGEYTATQVLLRLLDVIQFRASCPDSSSFGRRGEIVAKAAKIEASLDSAPYFECIANSNDENTTDSWVVWIGGILVSPFENIGRIASWPIRIFR